MPVEIPLNILKEGSLVAGKYRIVEEIGRGGMGIAYRAEDVKLKRSVALKFLPQHFVSSSELRQRFLIEAQAAAALSHPGICVVHEVGESEERPYIAMEYVEGETLQHRIDKGPLKAEEVLALAIQIAAGLQEAHGKGIIHRDIKSSNVMVTQKGQAKIMDFGLAKLLGGVSLTKSLTTLGTVAYMSPEQARGEELDGRTDIWSLGIVIYEMASGKRPFRGDRDQTVIHSLLHQEPEPLTSASPGTPKELEHIVMRALAKKADERYQTMEELQQDLKAVAEGLKPLKAKRRITKRRLGLKRISVISASLAAIILTLYFLNIGGLRDRIFRSKGLAEPAIKLAVLPFVNLSADPEQEYLSDGITQELIIHLGRLQPEALGVIARTSVMRYKKANKPVDQIGRELEVDYILEGSVRREANRIRIITELIHVIDQKQIWANTYEHDLSSILRLQSRLTQDVAKALAVKLLPTEQARLALVRTVNPEAYDAYLKGSFFRNILLPDSLNSAQRFFELALQKDPSYVLAYEGLTFVWLARQQVGYATPDVAGPKAKAAALQALALDETSAEAHLAMAMTLTWFDWNLDVAGPEWKRAIELNPNNANTQAYYSHYLAITGRAEEGMPHIMRARKLDPHNGLYTILYVQFLQYLRRWDEIIAIGVPQEMQFAYIAKGMRKEQLADQRVRIARDPARMAAFEKGLAEGGYEGAQRAIADVLASQYEKSTPRPYYAALGIAGRYLDAGDKGRAIDYLYKAYANRDPKILYIGGPFWRDPLGSDVRYQALLRRIGLPLKVN